MENYQLIFKGYDWIKVPRYKMNGDADWEQRYKELEEHHIKETSFLISEVRRLAYILDPILPFKNTGQYTPGAGTVEDNHVPCGVCGTPMPVARDKHGPTGYAEAMAGHAHNYDRYECPHIKELWHKQAIAIARQYKESHSLTIRNQLMAELKQVLMTRQPTIDEEIYLI